MNRRTLRYAVLLLGLATGLIHLYLNLQLGEFSLLFTLNGLGYLGLLVAFFVDLPFIPEERWIHYGFIAYTLITILAWVPNGQRSFLGYLDKSIEALLVLSLVWYTRLKEEPQRA
jgi:hypothetical protein